MLNCPKATTMVKQRKGIPINNAEDISMDSFAVPCDLLIYGLEPKPSIPYFSITLILKKRVVRRKIAPSPDFSGGSRGDPP